MKVAIIYHSGFGHTKVVAESIAKGVRVHIDNVLVYPVVEGSSKLDDLLTADTIVFGSPTYFGNVSAEFKKFMESTSNIWAHQKWKDKLAAGFTNSSTRNGDKLNTLSSLSLFAAQHGMIWLPMGILPKYDADGHQLDEHNGMASYLGLMTMSTSSHKVFTPPQDLITAELFGQRIGEVTKKFTAYKIMKQYENAI